MFFVVSNVFIGYIQDYLKKKNPPYSICYLIKMYKAFYNKVLFRNTNDPPCCDDQKCELNSS